MVEIAELLTDLRAESAVVDAYVAGLADDGWAVPTPAPGWTVAHQIAHLAWTDHATLLAVTDPDRFADRLAAAARSPESFVDDGTAEFLAEPAVLLDRWRTGRERLADALATTTAGRLPWYATTMTPTSMVTARIMETWAHGLDVADALGQPRSVSHRLRHVAHLGYATIGWGFAVHGQPAPDVPIRVELSAPDGALWTFGPSGVDNRVTGPALDFCLLVTQRAARDELALVATGPVARQWLAVAQAFAGPPGAGRAPRPTDPDAPANPADPDAPANPADPDARTDPDRPDPDLAGPDG